MPIWYLSFATDAGFLGAVYAEGVDIVDALLGVTKRGLNPGGEVRLLEISEMRSVVKLWHLYSEEELKALDPLDGRPKGV